MSTRRSFQAWLALVAAACGEGADHDVGGRSHVLTARELAGSYEVSLGGADETPGGVAAVDVRDRAVSFDVTDPAVALGGQLEEDGAIVLDGRTTNSDNIALVHGDALAERAPGMVRITVSLDDGRVFVLERPDRVDQSVRSGRYRFQFRPSPQPARGDGCVDVGLRIEANGRVETDATAIERDADDMPIATWQAPRIIVAPSGRFHLVAGYEAIASAQCFITPCRVEAVGTLPAADDVPTSGVYRQLNGIFMFQSGGDIEVTRRGPPSRDAETTP